MEPPSKTKIKTSRSTSRSRLKQQLKKNKRPDSPGESSSASSVAGDGLCWPSAGTRVRKTESAGENSNRLQKMSAAVETLLECIGEDPSREGLVKTPLRYAKALLFFTKGYEQSLWDIVNSAVFEEDHEEMVIVKNITVHSLCEHHLVPFTGKVLQFNNELDVNWLHSTRAGPRIV